MLLEEQLGLEWAYETQVEAGTHPSPLSLLPSDLAPRPQEELAILRLTVTKKFAESPRL